MATLTINIPDNEAPRIAAALCVPANLSPNMANSKAQVIKYLIRLTRNYERQLAANAIQAPIAPVLT